MVRTIIVDDEPLARSIIKEFLQEYEAEIEVVAECANGREAIDQINAAKPDLVLLDIQMPGLNGFDVIEQLLHIPQIIFSTANDSFAIDAFETGAIDYLLKPYNKERFGTAIQRVLQKQHVQFEKAAMQQFIKSLKQPETYVDHLFVRMAEKIFPVNTGQILWIEAAGDYSSLHTEEKSYLCSQGIGSLEKKLNPAQFVRVHRSSIIALAAIRHITSDGEGGYHAMLKNGQQVKVSRSYASRVREWIV